MLGVSEVFLAVGLSVGGALVRGRPEVVLEVGFLLLSEGLSGNLGPGQLKVEPSSKSKSPLSVGVFAGQSRPPDPRRVWRPSPAWRSGPPHGMTNVGRGGLMSGRWWGGESGILGTNGLELKFTECSSEEFQSNAKFTQLVQHAMT